MPFDLSIIQIVIVLVIALLVFGPKRLPEMARGLGKGLHEFKDSLTAESTPRQPPGSHRAVIAPAELAEPAADEAAATPPARDAETFVRRGDDQPAPPPA